MLIGGLWREPRETLDVRDPADGTVVGQVAWGGAADACAAADAAAAAASDWADTPARQRADTLRRAADLISERAGSLGTLLAAEAGKQPGAVPRGGVRGRVLPLVRRAVTAPGRCGAPA